MNFITQTKGVNLADARLGAKVISVTDDFFAPCHRMLNPESPVFIEGKFDDNGKWMDGWESRRKRVAGHDSCVVKLAVPGKVEMVDIDTAHFIGNFPQSASLEGCCSLHGSPSSEADWFPLVAKSALSKDSSHVFNVACEHQITHVRLNIFPDGGVARLRVYGAPSLAIQKDDDAETDLASLMNGGRVIACSDECFGSSMSKLNYPDRGLNMGDGWETARRRIPGNEWVIIQLAHPSLLESVELDTAHYKGNYPDRASLQAGYLKEGTVDEAVNQSLFWPEIMREQDLQPDAISRFVLDQNRQRSVTHVKVNIIPDGGLSRVRLFGRRCNTLDHD